MLDDLIKERLRKLNNLKEGGHSPYLAETKRTHFAENIKLGQEDVFVAGRIMGFRAQGGVFFVDVYDATGKIQVVVKKENISDFELFKNNLDIGDFVEAGGNVFKTLKGEVSVEAKSFKLLSKAIRPLPDQWSGIEDVELRLRKRYLDLLFHPEVRDIFQKKSIFWDACRSYLKKAGFLEVEAPVLESVPGGADAEPFITHHDALDKDFYLRISLELPLKKVLVSNLEKIFEIGRIFRNEGIDKEHLQDYGQCEFYWAYQDYNGLMKFVESMYKDVIEKTTGGLATVYGENSINWGKKWDVLDYYDLFKEKVGLNLESVSKDDLYKKAVDCNLRPEKDLGRGRIIDLLYKKLIRPEIIQPSFLVNPPVDIEPLAKRLENDKNRVARFQVVACGTELGKGFSENNDPIDQRERLEEQMRLRERGDKEAQRLDEDFLEAMEYGMPPSAGFGFSERLFAIVMNRPVRETVIFPLMKPKGK